MFGCRNTDELDHAQRIGGNLPAAVVADFAILGSGHDENLGNIVHAFHLGDKKLTRARLLGHSCSPLGDCFKAPWLSTSPSQPVCSAHPRRLRSTVFEWVARLLRLPSRTRDR